MADPGARQWFMKVMQIFGNKAVQVNSLGDSRKLAIANLNGLLACLHDTILNTVRQSICLLYSLDTRCCP